MDDADILLLLHRQYSKDEYVKLLRSEHKKELAELKIKVGKQLSYIQELEDKFKNSDLKQLQDKLSNCQAQARDLRKQVKMQFTTITELTDKLARLTAATSAG